MPRYFKSRYPDKKFLVKADVFCDFCGMENPNIDIDYVAKLARIELTPAEQETYSRQLGQILEYFQKLSEIDVSGVEPSAHAQRLSTRYVGARFEDFATRAARAAGIK